MIETFLGLTFAGLALLGVKIGVVSSVVSGTHGVLVAVGNGATACRRFSLVWGDGKLTARLAGLELKKTRREADNGS